MFKIKVSTKRQATFPKKLCDSLGIEPGDDILLDRRIESDREVWFLTLAKQHSRPWLGSLNKYAQGKSHEMNVIRKSIASKRTVKDS